VGTGGHLFPGLAVARCLRQRGGEVSLLISPKEVDQKAVQTVPDLDIVPTCHPWPAAGRHVGVFCAFREILPRGGATITPEPARGGPWYGRFTSAPPLLAARRFGARIFLHESNTIPGRANRYLSWLVARRSQVFRRRQTGCTRRSHGHRHAGQDPSLLCARRQAAGRNWASTRNNH